MKERLSGIMTGFCFLFCFQVISGCRGFRGGTKFDSGGLGKGMFRTINAPAQLLQTFQTSHSGKWGVAPAKPDIKFEFPKIKVRKLANGHSIYHVRVDRLPLVSIGVVFRAGSVFDPEGEEGLAVITGEMLKAGTKKFSSKQIAQMFEYFGAKLDVWTDYDTTTIETTCLRQHFRKIVKLLCEILTGSTFPEEQLKKLKKREIERLKLNASEPNYLAARQFAKEIYRSHPYSRYDATGESIRKITRKDVQDFYRSYFVAGSSFTVIAGAVDFQEAVKVVGGEFKKLRKGGESKVEFGKVPEGRKGKIVIVPREGSAAVVFKMGLTAVRRNHDDFVPLLVTNYLLGGSVSSRLFLKVREQQSLAYSIWSRLEKKVDVGSWYVYGSSRSSVIGDTIASTLHEIGKLSSEDIGKEEVSQVKTYIKGLYCMSMETTTGIMRRVEELPKYGLDINYWNRFSKMIDSVTTQRVKEVAGRYMNRDNVVIVLVGNEKKIKESISGYVDFEIKELSPN